METSETLKDNHLFTKEALEFLGVSESNIKSQDFASNFTLKSVFVPLFLNALRDQYHAITSACGSLPTADVSKAKTLASSDGNENASTSAETGLSLHPTPPNVSNVDLTPLSGANNTGHESSTPISRHEEKVIIKPEIEIKFYKSNGKTATRQGSHRNKRSENTCNKKADKLKQTIPNVNDWNAFPPIGSSVPERATNGTTPRRIMPTPVIKGSNNAQEVGNAFSPEKRHVQKNCAFHESSPVKECRSTFIEEERELLRKERKSRLKSAENIARSNASNDKTERISAVLETKPKREMISSNPDHVTNKDRIDLIVNAYVTMIDLNLVPNISAELYYLFQMLTLQLPIKIVDAASDFKNTNLLGTAHNCVYFAVSVLSKQEKLIKILDMATIHLLSNNPNIQKFLPQFSEELKEMSKVIPVVQLNYPYLESVCFQTDTDSKENFVSEESFQNFKKQRDMFYKLLLDWESNHSPDWTKEKNFAKQVQNIMSISKDATNFVHLARLFQSQMVVTCTRFGGLESKDPELLDELKRLHPRKYDKLCERFLVPSELQGPHATPAFQGSQQFFHDFLQAASSPALNQHLIDIIVARITELNNLEVLPSNSDDTCNDEGVKKVLFSTIHVLRLLGKFLGFLMFFPYQSQRNLPAHLAMKQKEVRCTTRPAIHIRSFVETATKERRLLLTLPWIVEYLSMMDPVASYLPYYQSVICLLLKIYHNELNTAASKTQLYLRLLLGWLFDTPNFPQSQFFCLKDITATNVTGSVFGQSSKRALDAEDLVDHNLIYASCAHLIGLKVMLKEFVSGTEVKNSEVRKITPVRAEGSDSFPTTSKSLEQKLEENFLNNQSSSTKATVSFVAERVASKIVNRIKQQLVPKFTKFTKASVDGLVEPLMKESLSPMARKKLLPDFQLRELGRKLFKEFDEEVKSYVTQQCAVEIKDPLMLLLPEDMSDVIKGTCCAIAKREVTEKVNQWVKCNIVMDYITDTIKDQCKHVCYRRIHTLSSSGGSSKSNAAKEEQDEILEKEEPTEMSEKEDVPNSSENEETAGVPKKEENFEHYKRNPAQFTENTLDFIFDVQNFMSNSYARAVEDSEVHDILMQIKTSLLDTLHSNQSLMQRMVKVFSVDLVMSLITCHPGHVSEELLAVFLDFWKCFRHVDALDNIVCPRNLLLLALSSSVSESWMQYETVITMLLKNSLISSACFESSCLSVMKQKWPRLWQQLFTNCMFRMVTLQCWQPTSEFLNSVELKNWSDAMSINFPLGLPYQLPVSTTVPRL